MISYKLIGTPEWFVVHYTDCGMQLFTDDILAGLLQKSLETATVSQDEEIAHGVQRYTDPLHVSGFPYLTTGIVGPHNQ